MHDKFLAINNIKVVCKPDIFTTLSVIDNALFDLGLVVVACDANA
jgi:hypothetical protein